MPETPTIIPANPGWFLVTLIPAGQIDHEKWPDSLKLEPVLAWIIRTDRDGDLEVEPVTTDGNLKSWSPPWLLQRPDGRYESPGDCWMESDASAIEELKEQHEKRDKLIEERRQKLPAVKAANQPS